MTLRPDEETTNPPTSKETQESASAVETLAALRQDLLAVQESERRMRSLLESDLFGFAISVPGGRWVEVNDKLCSMFGYSREELFQKSWSELTHSEDLPSDLVQYKHLLAGEIESMITEKRFIRKDGSIIHTLVNVRALRRPDRSVEYVAAQVQDITDRKQAEAEMLEHLRTIEQQQEAIRTLSTPIIHVWKGVLAVPIVGVLDSDRWMLIMDRLLTRITLSRTPHVIIDLTGVDTMDSTTAAHLMRLVGAIRLLGAQVIVSGIGAMMAQTIVASEIDLSGVVTKSTLHEALNVCISAS